MKKTLFIISAIVLMMTVVAPATANAKGGFNQGEVIRTRQIIAEGFGFTNPTTLGWGATAVSGWGHLEVSTIYRGYLYEETPVHSLAVGAGYLLSGKHAYGAFGVEGGLNGVSRVWEAENLIFSYAQTSFMFKPSLGFYLRGGLTLGPVLINAKVGYAWTFGMAGEPTLEGMELTSQSWTAPALTAGVGIGFGSRRMSRFDGDHRLQVCGGYAIGLGKSQSAYTIGMDWFRRFEDHWIGFLGVEASQTTDNLDLKAAYFAGKVQRIFFDRNHEGSWWNLEAGAKVGVAENFAKYSIAATCGDSNYFGGEFGKISQAPSFGGFLGVNVAPLELFNVDWHYGHIELGVKVDYSYTIPRGISLEQSGDVEATQQLISRGNPNQLRLGIVLRWTL